MVIGVFSPIFWSWTICVELYEFYWYSQRTSFCFTDFIYCYSLSYFIGLDCYYLLSSYTRFISVQNTLYGPLWFLLWPMVLLYMCYLMFKYLQNSRLMFFFFKHFKDVAPLSSASSCTQREISCDSYPVPLHVIFCCCFLISIFKSFLLYHGFWAIWFWFALVYFCNVSSFELLGSVSIVFTKFWKKNFFSSKFFLHLLPLSLSFHLWPSITHILDYLNFLHSSFVLW